jgi:hypothetical protein
VHTAAIAHALAIQIAESNSARPQSIEKVNKSFTSDFSYPGFSRIAQLCTTSAVASRSATSSAPAALPGIDQVV